MKQNLDVSQIIKGYNPSTSSTCIDLLCVLLRKFYIFTIATKKKTIAPSGPIIGFLCSKLEILESLRVAKYSSRDQYFDAFYL